MLDNWVLSICNPIYRKTLETVHMNLFTLGHSLEAKEPRVSLDMAEVADATYIIYMLCVTPITGHILHFFCESIFSCVYTFNFKSRDWVGAKTCLHRGHYKPKTIWNWTYLVDN